MGVPFPPWLVCPGCEASPSMGFHGHELPLVGGLQGLKLILGAFSSVFIIPASQPCTAELVRSGPYHRCENCGPEGVKCFLQVLPVSEV